MRLNETKRSVKAVKALNGEYGFVKSIVIVSPENPINQKFTRAVNMSRMKDLKSYLKDNKIIYARIKGKYHTDEDSPLSEHSLMIFNITIDKAKEIAGRYSQESFIFCDYKGKTPKFQYWELNSDVKEKILKQIKDGEIDIEDYEIENKRAYQLDPSMVQGKYKDANNFDNFYTKIRKKFKFQIPFFESYNNAILKRAMKNYNALIESNCRKYPSYSKYVISFIAESVDEKVPEKYRKLARYKISRGFV